MRELSLHILDIVQNSLAAGATLIEIRVDEDEGRDRLTIEIKDNGCGMDQETVERALDPFMTSRTTRKVGLGLPLFAAAAERCGGSLTICSRPGRGTTVTANFIYSHLDRAPLGDMVSTVVSLITANGSVDFVYSHIKNGCSFTLDTRPMRQILAGIPFTNPTVLEWLTEYIKEGLANLNGGDTGEKH